MADDSLFRQKAPQIMKLLMLDFGIEKEDAAAVLGNSGQETAGFRLLQEIHPTVSGSRGGWGWMQWTGPRRVAMEEYCKRNNLDPTSDKANYAWLFVELTGEEKGAITALRNAHTLEDKVVAFEKAFERAGTPNYPSRIAWAKKALVAYALVDSAVVISPIPQVIPPVEKPKETVVTTKSNTLWKWIAGAGTALAVATVGWHAFGAETLVAPLVTVTQPTIGTQVSTYLLSFLEAAATAVTAAVGYQVSTWLQNKKFLSKKQGDTLVGQNLDAGAHAAINYAKSALGPIIAGAVDDIAAQSAIVSLASRYMLPKFEESIDHLGFGPEDLADFIKARLHVQATAEKAAAAPAAVASTGTLADLLAERLKDVVKPPVVKTAV